MNASMFSTTTGAYLRIAAQVFEFGDEPASPRLNTFGYRTCCSVCLSMSLAGAAVGVGSCAQRAPKVDRLGLLESLPEAVVEAVREWERHLVEVDTGVVPGSPAGARPRPEYDPDTQTVTACCRAKAAELTAAGTKTSFRTVQRMRARYRDQGLWGLVDARSARGRKSTGNVDERAVEAARTVIAAQTGLRRAPDREWSIRYATCSMSSTAPARSSCRRGQRFTGCWTPCQRADTRLGRRRPGARQRSNPTASTPPPRRPGRVSRCRWTRHRWM